MDCACAKLRRSVQYRIDYENATLAACDSKTPDSSSI